MLGLMFHDTGGGAICKCVRERTRNRYRRTFNISFLRREPFTTNNIEFLEKYLVSGKGPWLFTVGKRRKKVLIFFFFKHVFGRLGNLARSKRAWASPGYFQTSRMIVGDRVQSRSRYLEGLS